MADFIVAEVRKQGRLTPEQARELARRYFREALQRLRGQFDAAEKASIAVAKGVSEPPNGALRNRFGFVEETDFPETRQLGFLLPPDLAKMMDAEVECLNQISRDFFIYDPHLQAYGLSHVLPGTVSHETFKNAFDRAITELLNVHKQYLSYEAEIKINDPWFKDDGGISTAHSVPTAPTAPAAPSSPKSSSYSPPIINIQKPNSPPISELFKSYIAESDVEERTHQKKQQAFDMWVEIIGDGPSSLFTKENARKYKETLLALPKNFKKRFPNQKPCDFRLADIPKEARLNPVTINSQIGEMRTFVRWCENNTSFEGKNPFSGLTLKRNKRAEDDRPPFSSEHLATIFSSPIYTGCRSPSGAGRFLEGEKIIWDAEYWVPLIALYSGARQQEICQLYVDDLKQTEHGWVFDINQGSEDKALKTKSSKRQIPIHSELTRLGLLDYANKIRHIGPRLFPDLPMGKNGRYAAVFSKRFGRHLRVRLNIRDKEVCFHSFRHNFKDALQNAGVSRDIREALMGHSEGEKTAHDVYGSGIMLELRFEGIKKVSYQIRLNPKEK
jgi:integrase